MEPGHLAALRSYAAAIHEITLREREDIVIPQIKSLRTGGVASSPEVLTEEKRVLLQGPPGSGKTHLMRYLAASLAENFLNSEEFACPVLVQARTTAPPEGEDYALWLANQAIEQAWGGELEREALCKALKTGNTHILFDGLDEILDTSFRISTLRALAELARANPRLSFIVSIRDRSPGEISTQSLELLSPWTILPFDEVRLLRFRATRFSRPQPLDQVSESRLLKESLGNPLILRLLFTYATKEKFQLPKSRGRLFEDIVHAIHVRERERLRASPPAGELERGLEVFAKALAVKKLPHMAMEDARNTIESDPEWNFNNVATDRLLTYAMERLVLLVSPIEGRIGFAHRVFYEYYLGRVLARNIDLVDQVAPSELDEPLIFAAGLTANPTSVITAAYKRRTVQLAISCCEESDQPEVTREHLVSLIANDLHPEYLTALQKLFSAPDSSPPDGGDNLESEQHEDDYDFYTDLQELWVSLPRRGAPVNSRGHALEEFAKKLFGSFFRVVETRLHHRVGEIDLVCEIENLDPFWASYGGDVWVECKNTESKASIEQINTFIGKLVGSRWRIGFFLSSSGFSRDAMRRVREAAANPAIPLIVPVSGDEIQHLIAERSALPRFFKKCVRKVA
ncbi:NACHT domain-containing protein [Streptomyces malaysiensis]|uniref:NACHT domain-containing protein n=1 Tax=Streptomyces malaysiensis TaxID=92644 RepID=UPI00322076B7|nr:NACHT domain-containing protein [Streptomyces malaysiensis]